jgi:simple sugar transport system permease protein
MSAPAGQLPRWVDYGLLPLINLAVAFFIAGLVVMFVGENPFEAVRLMIYGSLGYGEGLGFTLYYATNFIFTGLSVAIAFHAGLFNIGSEGQAYIGGLGVALVCLAFENVFPWYINGIIGTIAAFAFGAAWAFIPAWLQAKRGSHVVITTIMFNFLASALMVYLLVKVLNVRGSMAPETKTFGVDAHLPKLGWLMEPLGLDIGGAPLNISLFLALVTAAAVWALIWRTRFGYEMRTMGHNAVAAAYAGIPHVRTIVVTMLISGGVAGLLSVNAIMGDQHRVQLEFTAGAGFVGIAVALMGRSHPVGIILAAILFGMLYQGGAELAFDMPKITRDMIVVIQGLVILFAGALEHMFRPTLVRIFTPARRLAAETG